MANVTAKEVIDTLAADMRCDIQWPLPMEQRLGSAWHVTRCFCRNRKKTRRDITELREKDREGCEAQQGRQEGDSSQSP